MAGVSQNTVAHFIGIVLESGKVATLSTFEVAQDGCDCVGVYPMFSEDEAYPGIAFDTLDAAARMCLYLCSGRGFDYELIVFEDVEEDVTAAV